MLELELELRRCTFVFVTREGREAGTGMFESWTVVARIASEGGILSGSVW